MPSSSKRRAAPEYLRWLLATAAALFWCVSWGFWLGPVEPESKAGISETPWVSFLPTSESNAGDSSRLADNLALWSPAVFSLPSAMGFSRTALTNETGARPPLQVPGDSSLFLNRRIEREPGSGFWVAPDMKKSVRNALTHLPERSTESPVFGFAATTGTLLEVDLSGGLEEQRFKTRAAPSEEALLRDKPWEVVAFLDFNEEGKVSSVFLETKSTFEEVDHALLHALWRWQIEKAKGPLSGRVIFRSSGRSRMAGETPSARAL